MSISIVIFEDNALLRESIASMISLNDQYSVVGAHDNPRDVVGVIRSLTPAIVLMDIDMPGMTGIEAVRTVRKAGITVPILMLTVFDDNGHVFEAIKAGATGYLLKKHIPTKLFEALADTLAGGSPMSPSIARMVIASFHQETPKPGKYGLTPRETEVLQALSKGNSYKMIAAECHISLDTVRGHIKNIYEKLQVHSQTEAVSKAIQEKLV